MKSWIGRLSGLLLVACAGLAAAQSTPPTPGTAVSPRKVLHFAFSTTETSFDPAKINDVYSRAVTPHIFEALYNYDHLARPAKFRPQLADGMPEVSADYKTWTVKLKRGVYFADDPAFKGQKRELTAHDFVYSYKRPFDPALRSPIVGGMLAIGFKGIAALRDEALKAKRALDYDKPVEGFQALDRYTLRFELDQPRPRLLETLAQPDLLGAVAREVIEFYGDKVDGHPVGTGPFKLKQWRRGSLIVLEKNPDYRDVRYDAEPAADDADGQAILARLKGRRLPMIDEVRVSIIAESQPRWLAFLNGQIDMLATSANSVPPDFTTQAMPNGKLAPNLAKQGIVGRRGVNADSSMTFFNMEHPLVGGYTPDKVALRRAIALSYDVQREMVGYWKGAAIPAQSPLLPHTTGYDPAFKSEMSDHDPARARALLDLYGYVDKDGDGWREMPDGSPLVLEMLTQPEQRARTLDELWKKALDGVGLRVKFVIGQWSENLKSSRAGKMMIWGVASSAAAPDGQGSLARLYGPETGSQNMARFKLKAFDDIYERLQALPDGPERLTLFHEAKLIAAAYMPWKHRVHRIENELLHPWIVGYRRPLFWRDWWHMIDIDDSQRPPR